VRRPMLTAFNNILINYWLAENKNFNAGALLQNHKFCF